MLRPAGYTLANRLRIPCFALPGEVSLGPADHVSSEEHACSTRAGSATPAPPLTKLVSLVRGVFRRWLVSFPSVISRTARAVVPVLEA